MTTPSKTSNDKLVSAMRILAGEIESPDGVANVAIGEGADRIEELAAELARVTAQREEIVKQKWLDAERLDAIERMIRSGRYNAATGRTELTAINCHLVCTCGIRAVVDLAIEEGRVPSNGGAS